MEESVGVTVANIFQNYETAENLAISYGLITPHHCIINCPKCGDKMTFYETSSKWRCHSRKCRITRSALYPMEIRADQLQYYLSSLLLYSANIPAKTVEKLYPMHSKTVIAYYSKFRAKIHSAYLKEIQENQLSFHVQIDFRQFGHRKYNNGRIGNPIWVFGACDAQINGRVYMIPVQKRDQNTLIPLIQSWCPEGAIINSDCFSSYNNLDKYGFPHFTVNHSQNYVNPITNEHTQRIESLWNRVKIHLNTHCLKDRNHFEEYLSEWCFRYNHKYNEIDMIRTLISL